jgi:hypothetical protein
MAGFRNFRELVDAELDGCCAYWSFRKASSLTFGAGNWVDLSMSPGNPVPNYYASAPNIAATLSWLNNNGIRHAGSVSPKRQYLKRLTVMRVGTAARYMRLMLLDYLMYYPFLDMSETVEQPLTNSVSLTRYTDGAGVQIMPVIVAQQVGGGNVRFRYTNSLGVADRITPWALVSTAATVTGSLATATPAANLSAGPFMPLQSGDAGVRSIEGVEFSAPDIGLITAVLVAPLCEMQPIDADPCEKSFPQDFAKMPRIQDDAYLNFIACCYGTAETRTIHGDITTVWN